MKGVNHVEDVGFLKRHLSLFVVIIVKMGSDVERVSSLKLDNLIVFIFSKLSYQVNLVLERQEEQDRLLASHSIHVHVIHLKKKHLKMLLSWLLPVLGPAKLGWMECH